MEILKNKFKTCKCEDIDKKYLDKAGVGLMLELLLSSDEENSLEIKDIENKLNSIKYENLEIGGLTYNTKEYKKLLVDLSYGKDNDENVIWLSAGEYNEDGTPNIDSLQKISSLPIDFLVKNKFLENVEIEEDINGEFYLVFTFNTKDEDVIIKFPVKEFFSFKAKHIKLEEIIISINDDENVIVIESDTNLQDALKSLWERVLENDLDIKRIFGELNSWEPISELEIFYMFNEEQKNIINNIELGENYTLDNNLYINKESLNITGEYQKIDLNNFTITTNNLSEHKDLVIISNTEDNNFTNCFLENGKIIGSNKENSEYISTVLIQGNANVVLENIEIEGICPLYLLADNEINLTIKSGKFIAYNSEVIYIQNNNTNVIIEDGYFESINNDLLLNINSNCKNSNIEIIGGEFINYNPIKFVRKGYKVRYSKKENKNIYKVLKED